MAKRFLLFLAIVVLIPVLEAPANGAPAKVKIGIIYDVGGRGDKAINDAAAAGVDIAKKKFGLSNFDVRELVTTGIDFDRENRIEFLAKARYDLIIGVGPSFNEAMAFMSDEYPESQFAIVGSSGVESLNVSCMAFDMSQGAFLAGVMSALNSKSGKVGYLGDVSNPRNLANLRNFRAGVKYSGTKTKVLATRVTTSVQAEISAMSDKGSDIFFINWPGDGSVLAAVKKLAKPKKSIKIIGIRPEQYFIATKDARKFLIGYINQRFDSAIIDLFGAAVAGRTLTEIVDPVAGVFGRKYTLKNSGIDLISTKANSASKIAINRAKRAIISKKIVIVK
ncbi:MAG: BMP family ABC transporter substrate-binding protein [Actinomycetes bacterium]